jgi:hypothetical protein
MTLRRLPAIRQLIDGLVGAVIGNFELAVWAMFCVESLTERL